MNTYLPLILFTVLTNAAAQLMLKRGMTGVGSLDAVSYTHLDVYKRQRRASPLPDIATGRPEQGGGATQRQECCSVI